MSENPILDQIFKEKSLEEVSVETIEYLVNQWPYFSAGQFLLSKKYHQTGSKKIDAQFRKAINFTNNPLVFHYYLNPVKVASYLVHQDVDPKIDLNQQPVIPIQQNLVESAWENNSFPNPSNSIKSSPPENVIPPLFSALKGIPVENHDFDKISIPSDQPQISDELSFSPLTSQDPGILMNSYNNGTDLNSTQEIADQIPLIEKPEIFVNLVDQNQNNNIPDNNLTKNNSEEPLILDSNKNLDPLSPGNSIPFIHPVQNEPIDFIRPLYSEDYFAFQGIKLPEKIDSTKKPTEAQLHSFTDWLRAMKKPKAGIDPDNPASRLHKFNDFGGSSEDNGLTAEVEKLAIESISLNEEILTEAMAEVRVMQGQRLKAKEIYNKLSLIYPEKSAYFAKKGNAL